jgi:hypothetical protein
MVRGDPSAFAEQLPPGEGAVGLTGAQAARSRESRARRGVEEASGLQFKAQGHRQGGVLGNGVGGFAGRHRSVTDRY